MPRLLIVEDESKLLKLLLKSFQEFPQWQVDSASSAEEALLRCETALPDVILTDIRLPGMSGLDLLALLQEKPKPPKFLIMTAYASVGSAIQALRVGAVDYLLKPFPNEELMHALGRIEREIALANENETLRTRLELYEGPTGLIGSSEVIARLRRMIAKVAHSNSTVLIRGESGTGKELIARAIHEQSARSSNPLVRLNCGAIPEALLESELFGHVKGAFTGATERRIGRFELAGDGTIFLDEMGELPPALQVKLLRVLQEKEYEPVGSSQTRATAARIIAATNRNLESAIREGSFREDLFYRLNVVTILSPPLRERVEDIEELARHFIQRIANREGIMPKPMTQGALEILKTWPWPGNVRELENAIESALILGEGEFLEAEDLPLYLQPKIESGRGDGLASEARMAAVAEGSTLEEMERQMLLKTLEECGGNQSEAARRLGITRRTLGYRRVKYGL